MEEKIHIEENSVQETLIIPLYGRMKSAEMYPDICADPAAERLIQRLDYDFSKHDKAAESAFYRFGYLEAAKRCANMIIEINDYLKDHPAAAVVNLGCGLDETPKQCDNGSCAFYNVDLPDVIAARTAMLPAGERETNIPCDLTNHEWMDAIPNRNGTVFIAPGVFYYLKTADVKSLLIHMSQQFPNGKLTFDICNETGCKMMLKTFIKKSGIKDVGTFFSVSDAAREIAPWANKMRVVSKKYMTGYGPLRGRNITLFNKIMSFVADHFIKTQVVSVYFN